MLGAIIGAGASIIGGIMKNKSRKDDYRRERRDAINDQINKLPRLRESAEKAGFNPLTALEATGGSGFGQTGVSHAPLTSTSMIVDGVKGLADVATGETAKRERRQEVQDRLAELQLERLESGDAGSIIARTRMTSLNPNAAPGRAPVNGGRASPGREVVAADGPTTHTTPGLNPIRVTEQGAGMMPATHKLPEKFRREHVGPLHQSFTLPSGRVLSMPVGPDVDEVATGWVAEKYDDVVSSGAPSLMSMALGFPTGAIIEGAKRGEAERRKARDEAMKKYRAGIPAYMKD